MSDINNEYLVCEDPEQRTATYCIEIRNFRRKLGKAMKGMMVSSKKFSVNMSEFSIDIYIAGTSDSDGSRLGHHSAGGVSLSGPTGTHTLSPPTQ